MGKKKTEAMGTERPIVIVHGWSDTGEGMGGLVKFCKEAFPLRYVEELFIADWVSMNDEISYLDLALAMDRAWTAAELPRKHRSVDIISHSTGALVVREWMTTHCDSPDTCPIYHHLMLAPANFGSPLAHTGREILGRVFKGWKHQLHTGTKVLKGLEIASPYTWELAEKDVFSNKGWYDPEIGILATVLVGNTGYSGPKMIANKAGSDGTVRVSTANLNAVKLKLTYKCEKKEQVPTLEVRFANPKHTVAFAVIDGDNHGTIVFKDEGPRNPAVRELVKKALNVSCSNKPDSEWEHWCNTMLPALTEAARDAGLKGNDKKGRLDDDQHFFQNTVVRMRDSLNQSVPNYLVCLEDFDQTSNKWLSIFQRELLKNVHKFGDDSSYRSLFVDTTLLHQRIDEEGDKLKIRVYPEPSCPQKKGKEEGKEEGTDCDSVVGFDSPLMTPDLGPEKVKRYFAHNRTLLVDLIIPRVVHNSAFMLYKPGETPPKRGIGDRAIGTSKSD